MGTLLVFLFLISALILIVGLISPKFLTKIFRRKLLSRKQIGMYFGAATVFFFIAIAATNSGNYVSGTTNPTAQNDQSPTESTTQEPSTQQVQEPVTVVDRLWVAYDALKQSRDGIEIEYDESTKTVILTMSNDSFWDEKSLVRGAATTFVWYGEEVVKLEEVEEVIVSYKIPFTDVYGKKEVDDAVIISMSKSQFNEFDWANLVYQSIARQLRIGSLYMHPAIAKQVEDKDIYLSSDPR